MAALSRTTLLQEWKDSRKAIEDILGREVNSGSIPGGYYSKAVAETAAEAGLQELFTSEPTADHWQVGALRVFGRYSVQQATSAELVASIAAGDLQPRLQQYIYWNVKKLLKQAAGSYWLSFRQAYLNRSARKDS